MLNKIKSTKEICQRFIDTHKNRESPKGESDCTPAQKMIFQTVTALVHKNKSSILKYSDMKEKYKGGLLPSDFCYNIVNIDPDFEVKFLRYLSRGLYEFVGCNWDTADSIKITWSPTGPVALKKQTFHVGYYRNGKYKWDFTELGKFI